MARLAWATVYAAWGIPKPRSFANMFGNWLNGLTKNLKQLVLVGAVALCWSVWLCINTVIFYKKIFLFAGYLLDYSLAPYVGYSSAAYFTGYACSGVSFLDSGGQGFFSQAHGWWSSHRIVNH